MDLLTPLAWCVFALPGAAPERIAVCVEVRQRAVSRGVDPDWAVAVAQTESQMGRGHNILGDGSCKRHTRTSACIEKGLRSLRKAFEATTTAKAALRRYNGRASYARFVAYIRRIFVRRVERAQGKLECEI